MSYDEGGNRSRYEPGPWDEVPGKCNHRKYDGSGLCRNPAGKATDHKGYGACKKHGGNSPTHVKHAENLMLADEIASTLERYELDPLAGDPLHQLIAALRTAGAMRRIWAEIVGSLPPAALLVHSEKGASTHPFVAELRMHTAEAAKIAKQALDAGIAEREVKIHEAQAMQLGAGLRAGMLLLVEAVGAMVDDPVVIRRLNELVPQIARRALEQTGLIDVEATDG